MDQTTLPPEIAAELQNLRDIRLPDPVGWWPLASGVWALIALLCAVILAVLGWRAWRRRTLRYRALAELNAIARDTTLDGRALAEQIELLLKRLTLQGDRSLAAAHGEHWISRLTDGPAAMDPDTARMIANAPYMLDPEGKADRTQLIAAARRWIGGNA